MPCNPGLGGCDPRPRLHLVATASGSRDASKTTQSPLPARVGVTSSLVPEYNRCFCTPPIVAPSVRNERAQRGPPPLPTVPTRPGPRTTPRAVGGTTPTMAQKPGTEDNLGADGGILCLGLFRTGTYSITRALNILGYPRVLHGMDLKDLRQSRPWAAAAWGALPYIHTELYPDPARRPPWLPAEFTKTELGREDWDKLFGNHQSATDLASLYAVDLIRAYPNAKVILVERDVESWAKSLDQVVITTVAGPTGRFVQRYAEPLAAMYNYTQLWDVLRGWFRVRTADEMRAVCRERYKEHYGAVRRLVPADRLLDYRLGDGWEPLCEFLDKPKPDVPFPFVNEGKDLKLLIRVGLGWTIMMAVWRVVKYPALAALLWYLAARGEQIWGALSGLPRAWRG